MSIYFDHSATTPVDKKVLKEMMPYFNEKFGNPSSIHSFGQAAMAGVDKGREQVAEFLNCEPEEIIFTSGATESDNLALRGVISAVKRQGAKKPHVITTLIEHDAVLQPCLEMEKEGVEITFLPVKPNGVVDLEKLKKAIKDNTVLVSVMYVNSEVGSIQPIREIGKIIEKVNRNKLNEWKKGRTKDRGEKPRPIYFHTDATQALNFLPGNTKYLHVDLLSLSGHKIYGPKGVGALFVKKDVPLKAIQLGGHHEKNLRSGTLNVPGIVGLGAAISLLDEETVKNNNAKIAKLRNMLVDGIKKNIPDVILNTDRENSTPGHAHFSFLGVEGESILIALDLEGIAVSTGSACASGSLKASHVLLAMGIKKEIAHNSIRFSLGKNNTEAEIKRVIKILPSIIRKLRGMNPDYKK
ncbi:MAG: cysteine desulfurase family protein [Patescibacteria group bacterium]|nr:cysteine desulfurase family protein [Patescibacteria group bacterium]MDD5294451.1 cysteine desulfurase family protein [Patescibacteria group bacterium]MDD5554993.1 cysteine desulfurase family protein [Patescibacteria group bacterium]